MIPAFGALRIALASGAHEICGLDRQTKIQARACRMGNIRVAFTEGSAR